MRSRSLGAAFLLAEAVLHLSAQTGYRGKVESLPIAVAPQPIAFSHKTHAASGMKCLDCHAGAASKERAGLPDAAQCLLCHNTIKQESAEIRKLAAFSRRGEKLNWVRVYQVPDFVFFSHANHLAAGEQCITCHGDIQQRNVLAKEVSTSMIECMNCHLAREVSRKCHLCHDLGQ
jgi:hypothetical protein